MFVDEDNKIELKEILNGSLPKEIVAFLNSDGGTIYIGVNKKREIVDTYGGQAKNIDIVCLPP